MTEDQIYLGWNGILYQDQLEKYIKEKSKKALEREKKIKELATEIREIKTLLDQLKEVKREDEDERGTY